VVLGPGYNTFTMMLGRCNEPIVIFIAGELKAIAALNGDR